MAKEQLSESDGASDEKEEYVITESPPEQEDDEALEAQDSAESDEDERLVESEEDEQEPQSGRKALTPEEKRAQRQQRKFRRKAAIEHKEREIAYLRAENEEFKRRLQTIERKTFEFDKQNVDQRLNEANNEVETIDRIIAKAVEQGAGEDVAKALAIRDHLLAKQKHLKQVREQAEKQAVQAPKVDPRVAAYAKEWIGANDWYDPKGKDEDSAIVQAIDKRLASEGFNPATEDYWIELDNRVAKRLPHRYGDTQEAAPKAAKRGGPPVGGKREYAAPSTRKEIYISPERKQALIDAGVWDNPELRQRYIKRYADYDRNNSSR